MSGLSIISRCLTTFTASKEFDAEAFRASLQRFLDSQIIVYLGSGGSGEANLLTRGELERVYKIGVEVFGGRLPVYANFPEVSTAAEAIDYAQLAIGCGADLVNMYGPASLHGFVPSDAELLRYFDDVLSAIDHPVAVAPNPVQGYTPSPTVIAEVCHRHPHVTQVNLVGIAGDGYFLELREILSRDVDLNVPLAGSLHTFGLGARGLISNLANILPRTVRSYVDLYEEGDFSGLHEVYAGLSRFSRYVSRPAWRNPRWQKMALQVLGLPGRDGGLRAPFLMPSDGELREFREGLLRLELPEIDELASSVAMEG